jgi:hypothetical protein
MCDHFIGFHAQRYLYQPKALWRCSVCGRESRVPLDCCAHPDYASVPRVGIECAVGRWLSAVSARVWTGWRALIQHRRQPAVDRLLESDDAVLALAATARRTKEQTDDSPWRETHVEAEAAAEPTHVSV